MAELGRDGTGAVLRTRDPRSGREVGGDGRALAAPRDGAGGRVAESARSLAKLKP